MCLTVASNTLQQLARLRSTAIASRAFADASTNTANAYTRSGGGAKRPRARAGTCVLALKHAASPTVAGAGIPVTAATTRQALKTQVLRNLAHHHLRGPHCPPD